LPGFLLDLASPSRAYKNKVEKHNCIHVADIRMFAGYFLRNDARTHRFDRRSVRRWIQTNYVVKSALFKNPGLYIFKGSCLRAAYLITRQLSCQIYKSVHSTKKQFQH